MINKYTQIFTFILVGGLAAGVHLCIVFLLVEYANLNPLYANVYGFLLAFLLSLIGHSKYTFKVNINIKPTLKLFIISSIGFMLNQLIYYFALKILGERYYLLILFIVLILVPIFTFISAKFWAFSAK
jgi:putative flippase GtrA